MPPWSTIETIMFDMDGTLLDLHFDNFFWLKMVPQCYAKIKGITNKEAITVSEFFSSVDQQGKEERRKHKDRHSFFFI